MDGWNDKFVVRQAGLLPWEQRGTRRQAEESPVTCRVSQASQGSEQENTASQRQSGSATINLHRYRSRYRS
ncbi:unnamed protein product, partial [Staurois parvus]